MKMWLVCGPAVGRRQGRESPERPTMGNGGEMASEVAQVLAWPLGGSGRCLCLLEPVVPLWDQRWFLAPDKCLRHGRRLAQAGSMGGE